MIQGAITRYVYVLEPFCALFEHAKVLNFASLTSRKALNSASALTPDQ